MPYEQKLPQNNNQTSSNVVRSTTTNETINELSHLCPLNCYGLPTQTPINLKTQDLAWISSTSPPETPEMIVVLRVNICWIPEHIAQSSITELFGKSVGYRTQSPYKKVPI